MAIETKQNHSAATQADRVGRREITARWEGFPPRLVVYVSEVRECGGERRFVPAASPNFRGLRPRRPDAALWRDLLRRRRRIADGDGRRWSGAFRRDADGARRRAAMRAYRDRVQGRRRP